jgi:hypothetical protein
MTLFAVPYEDIARIVDRSPAAARRLASRARRRVRRAGRDAPTADRQIVDAFVAAALGGDLERLLAVPDPDVVLRSDGGGGALPIVEGARAVPAGARSARPRASRIRRSVDGATGFVAQRRASRSRCSPLRSSTAGSRQSMRRPDSAPSARPRGRPRALDAGHPRAAAGRSAPRAHDQPPNRATHLLGRRRLSIPA